MDGATVGIIMMPVSAFAFFILVGIETIKRDIDFAKIDRKIDAARKEQKDRYKTNSTDARGE